MADVLTILSNFVFLVPGIQAYRMHRWTRGSIFFAIIVFSSMYHACNSFEESCLFHPDTHRKLDFFFAQLVIPATALYIILFPEEWAFLERILLILFIIGIVLTQITVGETFLVQLIIAAVSFAFILLYWISYGMYAWSIKKESFAFPPYEWEHFYWGIALIGLACSLFATETQVPSLYWAVHSCWHSLAALGQYWILLIRPPAPRYANMDEMIRAHAVSTWSKQRKGFLVYHSNS